ncbi:hypothetical protein [Bacillus paramycoides]|uniref:hypothetical protein n=1 Tax=Bacillus paramycoides TaxID=2026194 RepID=UPI003D1C0DE4
MKCGTYNGISNIYDASNFSKAPPYTSISDSIGRDIGKYPIIEIGIFLHSTRIRPFLFLAILNSVVDTFPFSVEETYDKLKLSIFTKFTYVIPLIGIGGYGMKENLKVAWITSWFALLGQLVFFIGLSLLTENWRFTMWSFMVSMIVGVPSIIHTYKSQKIADTKR